MRPQMQPQLIQGRAFAAPRMASLERARADAADIDMLKATLDASPRKRYREMQMQAQQKDSRLQQYQQHYQQQPQTKSRSNYLRSHSSFDSQRGALFPHIYNNQIMQPQHHSRRLQNYQQYEPRKDSGYKRQPQRMQNRQEGSENNNKEEQHLDRDIQYGFEYQTPPSNRKARLVDRSEADNLAHHLRHARSDELNIQPTCKRDADEFDHHSHYQRQRRHQPQAPASSAIAAVQNANAGNYADIGFGKRSPGPSFRDADVEQTLNLQRSVPVLTSASMSAPVPSLVAKTSGQMCEGLEQQRHRHQHRHQRQTYGDCGDIIGIGADIDSHRRYGRSGISSLGGSVLRRLEPNRVFESRRKRNADRDRDRDRDHELEWQGQWQKPSNRDAEKKRERSRGRAIFPAIAGAAAAAGKNTKFGTHLSSVAPPAPAPSPLVSSQLSSQWEARRYGDGDGDVGEKERARHWI